MFQIGLTIVCAIFVIGYIFFSAASSERTEASETGAVETPGFDNKDAA